MVTNLKLLIKSNKKTFISILLLITLGVGFLVGIKSSTPNLKKVVEKYYEKYKVYDLSLTSALGFTEEEIGGIKKVPNTKIVSGNKSVDELINIQEEAVLRINSYRDEDINNLEVIEGRLPKKNNEIVIEARMKEKQKLKIGDLISIDSDKLNEKTFTIVGVIKSPIYLSNNIGETNLLSGKVNYYSYVPIDTFTEENYSNIYIRVNNKKELDKIKNQILEDGTGIIEKRYKDTIEELNTAIVDGEKELEAKKNELADNLKYYQDQIDNAELQLDSIDESIPTKEEAEQRLNEKRKELKELEDKLSAAKQQIDQSEREYNEAKKEYDEGIGQISGQLDTYESTLAQARNELQQLKNERDNLQNEYNNTTDPRRKEELSNLINSKNSEINLKEGEISFVNNFYLAIKVQADEYQEKLNEANESLNQAKKEYNIANNEYLKYKNELDSTSIETILENAKNEVANKRKELEAKKKELEANKKKYEDEIKLYQNKLDDAKDLLKYLTTSSWKLETIYESRTYNQYLSDIKRIENISNFFPIIFYLVAILVTLTNTTRIVENDREKIGLLKAFGYSRKAISNSYYLFALIAAFLGSILGIVIGFLIIPKVFYTIYLLIYNLPNYTYYFDIKLSIISMLLAIVLIFISVDISIKKTLKERPTVLLRPKEVKTGKRVILEKITFIWNRLSFTSKVTIRNLFKYPKRFLMTIIGISGCIALIVSGFNLRSSISNIIPIQYGNIFDVDIQIFVRDSLTRGEIDSEKERINNIEEVSSSILVYLKYAYINDYDKKVNLVIPEDNNLLSDFVLLKDGNKKYELDDEGAIVTKKVASILGLNKGDTISIKDSENNVFKAKINHIVENYVDNYIYLSKKNYEKTIDSSVKYNSLLVRLKDMKYSESNLSKEINKNNTISYLTFTSTAKVMYDSILLSLNYIVYVLVVSAIILAFIVLYNLNTLNVFERRREIATIKVLGFTKKETYKYIENEIKILIFIGIIVGVLLGYVFSNILISSCELDSLMYDYRIVYINYVYAIGITILFLIITSLLSRKSINKINMIESLKKNE